jgi:hypothetical protein
VYSFLVPVFEFYFYYPSGLPTKISCILLSDQTKDMGNESSKSSSRRRELALRMSFCFRIQIFSKAYCSTNLNALGNSNPDSNGNVVACFGNANAEIVGGGNAAAAMAQGSQGQAAAWSDGYQAHIYQNGMGRAGVDGGMAWAQVGKDNMAVAFCGAADARNKAIQGGEGLNQLRIANCDCASWKKDCASGSCKCSCHFFS